MEKKAIIMLENGYYEYGTVFAGEGEVFAEVVFNTSMTGYEEIISDPSYKGQAIIFTNPLIGNYGINVDDMQSEHIQASAVIIREASRIHSNFRSKKSLKECLEESNVIGIHNLDTRALTKQIRMQGAMKGGISTLDLDPTSFLEKVKNSPSISDVNLFLEVIDNKIKTYEGNQDSNKTILAIDFGIKSNIIKDLCRFFKKVILVPFDGEFENRIKDLEFDGVFLSNGPGDPRIVKEIDVYLKKWADSKLPIIGICFGHQLIGQSFGLNTYKMSFGHHGGNHPVLHADSGKVFITAQNHNYAISEESIAKSKDWEITWKNLFDGSVEGIRHKSLPISCVQYHPEASPGPNESNNVVFQEFYETVMQGNK